jgi:copper oxidase (laccase) domain-containing protein
MMSAGVVWIFPYEKEHHNKKTAHIPMLIKKMHSPVRPGLPVRIKSTLAIRPFKDLVIERVPTPEGKKKASRVPQIFLFGRPHDWAGEEKTLGLQQFLMRKGVKKLYAPYPTKSNAIIAPKDAFTKCTKGAFILNGKVDADGVVLDATGQACIIKSADCPTIVAFTLSAKGRKCVVAHASRDSLIDPHFVGGLGRSRNVKSVVDSVMAEFSHEERQEMYVYTVLGIGAKHYAHPVDHGTFGRQNRELIETVSSELGTHCFVGSKHDGRIDLHEVIKAQFARYQDKANIRIESDRSETFEESLAGAGTGFRWWSNRRGDAARNAVVVAF